MPVPDDDDNQIGPDDGTRNESFGWWRELGDESDDDLEPTAPLPLEDRIWRHPSEVALDRAGAAAPALAGAPSASSWVSVAGWRPLVLVGVTAALAGATLTAGTMVLLGPNSTTITERVVERQLAEPVALLVSSQTQGTVDVALIADVTKPSVVGIEVTNALGTVTGAGSGVVIRDDGHIVTNHHVVAEAFALTVITTDGHRYGAQVVGSDPLTDIAVIWADFDGRAVRPVVMGSTAELRVGEPAVAIGSPLRLEGGPSVTVGVISAVGRSLALPGGGRLYDLVQTDAPIAPGSSGGALLDANGALIGITTLVAVGDLGAEGLGFATPVEIAYDVAVDLMTSGYVDHGFLGISGDDLTANEASMLGLTGGALVTGVGSATPAELAGLEPGDIITAIDGVSVPSMSWLVVDIRRGAPGEWRQLEVQRGDDVLLLDVALGERPE